MNSSFSRIINLAGTYSIGNLAQGVILLLLIPVYTTYLSPKDFGIIALMGITISLIIPAIIAPLPRFYYKPEYLDRNELLLFNLFLLVLVKSVFLTLVYWIFVEPICNFLFDSLELVQIVRLYACVLLLTPASGFLMNLIRLKEMARFSIIVSLSKLVLSSGLVLYLLIYSDFGVLALVIGDIAGLALSIFFCLPAFIKSAQFRFYPQILKEPLKFGAPLIPSEYSNLLIQSGDRYVIRIFDSVGAVGLYSFGYQIAEILNALLVNPVKEGIMPHIYKMEKEPEDQKAFIKSSALYYYVVAMFFALGLSLYARELVMLLARREEFWPSWEIIPIISLCCVFHGLGNFLGLGMVMRSKTALFSATVIVSAMVNIGLNFVLIPTFGLVGAAMATLMSYFIWNGLKSYYSFKFYHLCFDFRRLGSITLVGVILYFVSVVLANTGSFSLNLFIKALILSVYPLTFFMTSFFTLDEKNFIQNFWTNLTRAR